MFTNIVALSRATDNDIHFDSGRDVLYRLATGETVCYAKRLGGHWALMHREPTSTLDSTQSIFSTSKRYQPTTAPNTTTMLSPDLRTSAPDPPTSAPVAMTATSTTSTTSPKSSNTAQPAARAKKTTCRRCKKQFESGNKLHKHLRKSCRYTQQQRETRLNTTASSRASPEAPRATPSTAISKASPYQTTTQSLDQIQTSTSGSTPSVLLGYSSNATPSVSSATDQVTTPSTD